jgi:hypothetical protein
MLSHSHRVQYSMPRLEPQSEIQEKELPTNLATFLFDQSSSSLAGGGADDRQFVHLFPCDQNLLDCPDVIDISWSPNGAKKQCLTHSLGDGVAV